MTEIPFELAGDVKGDVTSEKKYETT